MLCKQGHFALTPKDLGYILAKKKTKTYLDSVGKRFTTLQPNYTTLASLDTRQMAPETVLQSY